LAPRANFAYEIVIDGVDEDSVRAAMRSAMHAAVGDGVLAIGAGNFGGSLGKVAIHLCDLLR
jgi:formylmethanofuran--tetrahydromethanopterin N-formyltransferase